MEKKKARIEIKDLPKNMKVSEEEMKKIMGGSIGGIWAWLMDKFGDDSWSDSGGSACGIRG